MPGINNIFGRIETILYEENHLHLVKAILHNVNTTEDTQNSELITDSYSVHKTFLKDLIHELEQLKNCINNEDTVQISVKNQKLIRTCFQLIVCLGISPCLLPGLGISLSKRSSHAIHLVPTVWTDVQKYEMLMTCIDFFHEMYYIPTFKTVIQTLHLSDYLASLIQLSFAPLKKPGVYKNFNMTQEMYDKLNLDRQKYIRIYEEIVSNCFQPILIKELLVLQGVSEPPTPLFAKRVIAKELSRQLLRQNGLLSLIRSFVDTYSIDIGLEWKKIDMICKIIAIKHGNCSEIEYLVNICSQLKAILSSNNTYYLATAMACIVHLHEKFPQSTNVKSLTNEIFQTFDYNYLTSLSNLPGTIILTSEEVNNKINVLHAYLSIPCVDWPISLLTPNLYVLFLLNMACTKSNDTNNKLKDILLKCLEKLTRNDLLRVMRIFLFGDENDNAKNITVEEYDSGLAVKYVTVPLEYPKSDALSAFLQLFKASTSTAFTEIVFEGSLDFLIDMSKKRNIKRVDGEKIFDSNYEKYIIILHLLSEISESPKVISSLKSNPLIVLNYIENFISTTYTNSKAECVTIALVLLNTILSNTEHAGLSDRLDKLVPVLKSFTETDSECNKMLCEEAISLIESGKPKLNDTPCQKAINDIFDNLLPIRAHGILSLTKLIETKDPETISKKYYIFCLIQEQLKDTDSYVYLSAINGIVALGTHCPEDVLHVLCKEFLQISMDRTQLGTKGQENKIVELRMKVGDSIVKITRNLGEMAILHKTILLNTVLCACRDEEPLIRTSALSNLAEIALVLNYRIGSIIYEILLCVWSIIETDKAVECRRAAVMVISSLIKGLGKETLIELKDNLLPIYRSLKELYRDENEDSVLRLHAQIALEELNEIVNQFLFPVANTNRKIFVLDDS